MFKKVLKKIMGEARVEPGPDATLDLSGDLTPRLPEDEKERMDGDIIFLSPDPWNPNRWARKQMFAFLMQMYFDRVLYCIDYRRSGTQQPVLKNAAESVFVYYQGVGTRRLSQKTEERALKNLLKTIKRLKLKPRAIVAYQFQNEALARRIADTIPGGCKVFYDLTDDWTNFPGFSADTVKKRTAAEEKAIRDADKVFAVSRRLYEWGEKINPNTLFLPNATDFEVMKTTQDDGPVAEELKCLKRPVIGYTGRITPWRIDWDLLGKIAGMEEAPTIVMVGEVHPQSVPLKEKLPKNVIFLGPRQYYKLPEFYRGFDVCILPHSLDTQTQSMDPIKLYDYMGSGKPIVAMGVEEAKKFADFIRLAEDHEGFLFKLREAWQERDHDPAPQMEAARQNSWLIRAEELAGHIRETINGADRGARENPSFKDNEAYWLERHVKLKDDIRSVGNLGNDIEINIEGYKLKNERLRIAILQNFDSMEGRQVLEVGCGIGMMAASIVELGAEYTGVDISEVALEKAGQVCPSGRFIRHSIVDFDLDFRFDLIFCTDVLVHLINNDNWYAALNNMKKHLKPGGLIIIKEEIAEERESPVPYVVSRSLREYQDACGRLGLGLERIASTRAFYKLSPDVNVRD